MDKHVKVTAVKGNVIIGSKNPEVSFIRVESRTTEVNAEGWAVPSYKSAFIKGAPAVLAGFGFSDGQMIDGNIQLVETLEAPKFKPEDAMKMAGGDTGVACSVGGSPIYKVMTFSGGAPQADVLLAHDNKAEIKAAQAALELATKDAGLANA
jgi:hypothetical protein